MDPMLGSVNPVAIQTDATSVSFNWHLFSGAYTGIDEPLTNAVDAALGNMIGYVNPTLKVLLTIYIIWIALQARWVPTGAPVSGLIAHAARGAVIVMLLSNTATLQSVGRHRLLADDTRWTWQCTERLQLEAGSPSQDGRNSMTSGMAHGRPVWSSTKTCLNGR